MEKKGTPASPAMARASSVLPVPGGPISSTPFGIRPPRRVNFRGSLRKAMISVSSSFASSAPATSSKVILRPVSDCRRARDFPKLIALPPAPWSCRMMSRNSTNSSTIGSTVVITVSIPPSGSLS